MTIRPKIKEIAENTEKFELSTFHDGGGYENYTFIFKETKVKISIYGFIFSSEVKLSFSDNIIDFRRKEEKLLLKAFKQKRKKWKKENPDVVSFNLAREIQQNDLLNKINFKK